MTFTAQAGTNEVTQVIETEEGSHVYLSRGEGEQENQFVEWGDLSAEQQQGLTNVQDVLSHAFVTAREATAGILEGVGGGAAEHEGIALSVIDALAQAETVARA